LAVYNRALDIVRTALDLTSFSDGRPWTLILEKYTGPDGKTRAFGLAEPWVEPLCTAVKQGDSYLQVLGLLLSEPPLFYALQDLIEAIKLPRRPVINCARVVDTLRSQIAGRRTRKVGWQILQQNLQISQPYLAFITDLSKGHRHGDWQETIDPDNAKEATIRTWVIMNRFLEFRKRGNEPLPPSDFPLL
jgi:hypothetical protein